MPWGVFSLMSLRQEFVELSEQKAVSFSEMCQRYGISRKTGYKWLTRASAGEELCDRVVRKTARQSCRQLESNWW